MIFNDFANIPLVFLDRYTNWFLIWAKNARRWGNHCYFPLVPMPGRPVLIDIPVLDGNGQVPFIVVELVAKQLKHKVKVQPATRHDADLIRRHSETLMQ